MREEKEGFVFCPSFLTSIERLPEKEQLEAYRALCHYGIDGEWPEEDLGLAMIVLDMAKPFVDSSKHRYQTCKENGKKGGNPNFKKGQRNPYYSEDNQRDNPEDNLNKNKNINTNINRKKDSNINTNTAAERGEPRGRYGNVFLSSEEMERVYKLLPNTWEGYIDMLSREIEEGRCSAADHYRALVTLAKEDLIRKAEWSLRETSEEAEPWWGT